MTQQPNPPLGGDEAKVVCQACGGSIEGWICQGCDRVFRENDAGNLVYAAPVLPVEVREADKGLIAVRDALLIAGGADLSNGVCRFSYWNLDKLNKAFDAALATIKGDA